MRLIETGKDTERAVPVLLHRLNGFVGCLIIPVQMIGAVVDFICWSPDVPFVRILEFHVTGPSPRGMPGRLAPSAAGRSTLAMVDLSETERSVTMISEMQRHRRTRVGMFGNSVSLAVSIKTVCVGTQTTHQCGSGRAANGPLHIVAMESCGRLGEAIQIQCESFASVAAQDRAQVIHRDEEHIVLIVLWGGVEQSAYSQI